MRHSHAQFVRRTLAMLVALSLSIIPVPAKDKPESVLPGNWGAVQALEKGKSVSVRMTSGDRMEGKFAGLDNDSIRLMMDRQERVFPRNAVAEVWQLRVPDRKINGILIGMLAGGGAGGAAAAAAGANCDGEDCWSAALVMAGVGLGALIGGVTDSVIKSDKLLYRK